MNQMRFSLNSGESRGNGNKRTKHDSDDDDITEIVRIDDSDSDSENENISRKIKQKQVDSIVIPDDATPSTSRQAMQSGSVSSKSEAASSSTDKMLSLVTEFIIEDLHTTSIVKDSGFKKLISTLKPDAVLPSQDDILNHILLLYGIERSNLLVQLHSIENISIAIERWTSFTENTYATVKANFINDDFEPQSYVLATVQLGNTNSFGLLNDKVIEVLKHWEIEKKVVSTVYDWYRPPVDFLSPCQYQELGKKMCCFALKLQTAIDNSLNSIPEIKAIIEKCNQLVSYFLHNNVAEIYLNKYQNYLDLSCDQLVQAWSDEINSTYLMLDRLLSQKLAIDSVLRDTDATDATQAAELQLNENEWLIIKEMVATLKPFQLAKLVLYRVKEHIDSVSVVKPMIYSFCTNFLSPNNEINPVPLLKQRIKEDLLTKFQLYVGENEMTAPDYFDIATYLDPRYKKQEYMSDENRETVKQYIHDVYFAKNETTSSGKPSKWAISSKALSILFPSAPNESESECLRYHNEPEIDKNLSPHKWWKLHESKYPILTTVAKRYLCTHSTSKSIFTSRNASLRRKNLSPQIVDKLIFLNHKLKFDII
ncbi:zinc finger BED domain-containing protein 1-like [Contarinia nasturtii]|uniref:zinc finger BED domain-containing protein 1-like n=1 Tax=Contarinia nasturtii TaxID=265458 RepID=UPI0012D4176D|nr:zinc finger BED domain-containing protein 1-like [Contarinia nasturtii]